MHPVKVDIWSDVACPWCYIGKRRLEAGIARFEADHPGAGVEVEYHSFVLSPDTPADFAGTEVDFLVRHKGLAEDQVRDMLAHVARTAAGEGLDYDFDALQVTGTAPAHELLHHAKAHGKQVEVKERLFRAHFVEGRHVGRLDDLVELATEAGLDPDAARRALEDRVHRADVRADQERAATLGIRGVPLDRKSVV